MTSNDPFTKPELLAALSAQAEHLTAFFLRVPDDAFFAGNETRWSPALHAQHLVQSVTPVARALAQPDRLPARTNPAPSRTLPEIREAYLAALAAGAKAFGRYTPVLADGATRENVTEALRASLLALRDALSAWPEEHLDRHDLPHPVLGLMSAREIVLFTLLHDTHHENGVRRLLNAPAARGDTPGRAEMNA